MYCTTIEWGTPAYDDTIHLRNVVLRKPLDLYFKASDLSKEFVDIHLVCYNDFDELLACMVLTIIDNKHLKMRQVAVDLSCQKKGIGSLLVEASEQLGKSKGFSLMVLNARETAIPFYERMNYLKEGKPFIEVGLKHFKMIKSL